MNQICQNRILGRAAPVVEIPYGRQSTFGGTTRPSVIQSFSKKKSHTSDLTFTGQQTSKSPRAGAEGSLPSTDAGSSPRHKKTPREKSATIPFSRLSIVIEDSTR